MESRGGYYWYVKIPQCGYMEHELKDIAFDVQQGKTEGFDSCDWPSNLTQIGFKSSIFQPIWPWNLMDDPKKQ